MELWKQALPRSGSSLVDGPMASQLHDHMKTPALFGPSGNSVTFLSVIVWIWLNWVEPNICYPTEKLLSGHVNEMSTCSCRSYQEWLPGLSGPHASVTHQPMTPCLFPLHLECWADQIFCWTSVWGVCQCELIVCNKSQQKCNSYFLSTQAMLSRTAILSHIWLLPLIHFQVFCLWLYASFQIPALLTLHFGSTVAHVCLSSPDLAHRSHLTLPPSSTDDITFHCFQGQVWTS